jgi:hypothetical protein
LLSRWGVDFEGIDVQARPEAQGELERLGVPQVPATVLGERFVHGWNPGALAGLLGVPFDDTPALSPAELAETLDNILYYAQHLAKRLDARQLSLRHPARDRTLLHLAHHAFRLSAAYLEAMERLRLEYAWLVEPPGSQICDGPSLAAYGEQVRDALQDFFAAAPVERFQATVRTYYGEQSAHLLLERTTWHAGQHLRQVYDLLARDGSLPVPPLAPEVFEGLPIPAELW